MEKIEVNSPTNQAIKRKLVEREVLCQVNQEVEFILQMADQHPDPPFSEDDITNMFAADRDELNDFIDRELDGDDIHELQERFAMEYDENQSIDIDDLPEDELQQYLEEYHDFEARPAEILEWWKVCSWFEEVLRNHGECTIPHANLWGRQTSGQAILLDNVISEIAMEMKILEGQENEWKLD